MTASVFIRRYVNSLCERQIFSTRDVLHFGSRTSVDKCLEKLVTQGRIVRVTRGLFMRGDDTCPLPSAIEVAIAKAGAFGKEVSVHGDDLAAQLMLAPSRGCPNSLTFWVDGHASSFWYRDTKIVFKSASARKIQLVKKGGPAISLVALWHLGRKKVTRAEISMTATFNNHERQQLKQSLNSVPQWLSKFYVKEPEGLHQYLTIKEYRDQLHGQPQLSFDCQHT